MQTETLPPGTILRGRYRIERALGSGGFGHVYLSVDLQSNKQFAIKEYLVTGTSGKAQLDHESEVLHKLHHPNLPAYLAAFDERGHYYVVLGYIEGNDLTDYIRVVRQKNEVIPVARLMEWLLAICDAVAFLHNQHPPIIHRDIKPDNIRIMSNGTAMLVDLGNAKTATDGSRTLFFIRHQGTPGYAPLEQYPGGTGTDERSDIYALGGTLYFALTAQEPPSVSVRNQALQQRQPDLPSLQERLAQNPPDVPQEQKQFRLGVSKPAKPTPRHSRHLAQLGTLPPELLQKLDAIIRRAMAMKPAERYQTVTELSRDLRMVLQALPTSTMPPVVKARPVDIHSTQPDLPMLYDSLQPAPDTAQSAPPVTPVPANRRCPRCGAELTRQAPYCPQCGSPLTPPPQPGQVKKNQASAPPSGSPPPHTPAGPDISDVATVPVPPQLSPREQARPVHPQPQSASQVQARQQMLQTPPQSVSAIPRIQAPAPASTVAAQSQVAIQTTMPQAARGAASASAQIPGPSPAAPSALPAHPQEQIRKTLVAVIIVIVTLAIVALLVLVFLHGQHRFVSNGWIGQQPPRIQAHISPLAS